MGKWWESGGKVIKMRTRADFEKMGKKELKRLDLKKTPVYNTLNWLYKNGSRSKEQVHNHLRAIKTVGNPIKTREFLINEGYVVIDKVKNKNMYRTMFKISIKGIEYLNTINAKINGDNE